MCEEEEIDGVDFSILLGFVQSYNKESLNKTIIVDFYYNILRTDKARRILKELTNNSEVSKQAKFVLEMAGL